ncbi:hypothetical protein BC828DRAFT_412882 [Blastocladiella britannica]|nr:hypothetical protein BC828DRAFT_412882 [Blastocladiella britannica]
MATLDQTQNYSTSLTGLGLQFAFTTVVSVVCIGAFAYFRRTRTLGYIYRAHDHANETVRCQSCRPTESARSFPIPPALGTGKSTAAAVEAPPSSSPSPSLQHEWRSAPRSLWSTIRAVFQASEPFIVAERGLDAAMFLRFNRMCMYICLVLSLTVAVVLVPLHVSFTSSDPDIRGGDSGNQTADAMNPPANATTPSGKLPSNLIAALDTYSILNLPSGTPVLYFHAVFAVGITAMVLVFLYHHTSWYIPQLHAARLSAVARDEIHTRSILVTNVPPVLRSEAALAEYFTRLGLGDVESVVMNRRVGKLARRIEKAMGYLQMLELAHLDLAHRYFKDEVTKSRLPMRLLRTTSRKLRRAWEGIGQGLLIATTAIRRRLFTSRFGSATQRRGTRDSPSRRHDTIDDLPAPPMSTLEGRRPTPTAATATTLSADRLHDTTGRRRHHQSHHHRSGRASLERGVTLLRDRYTWNTGYFTNEDEDGSLTSDSDEDPVIPRSMTVSRANSVADMDAIVPPVPGGPDSIPMRIMDMAMPIVSSPSNAVAPMSLSPPLALPESGLLGIGLNRSPAVSFVEPVVADASVTPAVLGSQSLTGSVDFLLEPLRDEVPGALRRSLPPIPIRHPSLPMCRDHMAWDRLVHPANRVALGNSQPTHVTPSGDLVHAIDFAHRKLHFHLYRIALARDFARISDRYRANPQAFVTFSSPVAAVIAAQTLVSGTLSVRMAPEPRDIVWSVFGWADNTRRVTVRVVTNLAIGILTFIWIIPISLVVALANLDSLVRLLPFLSPVKESSSLLRSFLTSVLPTFTATLFNVALPYLLMGLLSMQGIPTKSVFDERLTNRYFAFLFINQLVFFVIGQTVITTILNIFFFIPIELPGFHPGNDATLNNITSLAAKSIPKGANFYLGYIVFQANLHACELLQINWGVFIAWWTTARWVARTPRDLYRARRPWAFQYFYYYCSSALIMIIALLYSLIHPLVLPIAFIYFAFGYMVYKHNLLYCSVPSYETNGKTFLTVVQWILLGLGLFQMTMAGMLASNGVYWAAALMLPLLGVTVGFKIYLDRNIRRVSRAVPIELLVAQQEMIGQRVAAATRSRGVRHGPLAATNVTSATAAATADLAITAAATAAFAAAAAAVNAATGHVSATTDGDFATTSSTGFAGGTPANSVRIARIGPDDVASEMWTPPKPSAMGADPKPPLGDDDVSPTPPMATDLAASAAAPGGRPDVAIDMAHHTHRHPRNEGGRDGGSDGWSVHTTAPDAQSDVRATAHDDRETTDPKPQTYLAPALWQPLPSAMWLPSDPLWRGRFDLMRTVHVADSCLSPGILESQILSTPRSSWLHFSVPHHLTTGPAGQTPIMPTATTELPIIPASPIVESDGAVDEMVTGTRQSPVILYVDVTSRRATVPELAVPTVAVVDPAVETPQSSWSLTGGEERPILRRPE